MRLAAALLVFSTALAAHAKTFTNSYVSFELPDKWNCNLEQTEWVCSPGAPAEQPQAIIILTAKEVGPNDSIPAYAAHLKIPKQITGRAGNIITSEVLTVDDKKKIADQPWVDGFHKSSEVPNYLTRYLATTKGKIAVLVTFSAHQLYYSKYSADFLKAIGSLRVIAMPSLGAGGKGGSGDGPFGTVGPMDFGQEGALPEEGGPGGGGKGGFGEKTKTVLAIALILAAAGIYLMIKKNKKKR